MNYGMYTELGNTIVGYIVEKAKRDNLSQKQVYNYLCDLADSNYDRFGEATDTAVREAVYSACGFYAPSIEVELA